MSNKKPVEKKKTRIPEKKQTVTKKKAPAAKKKTSSVKNKPRISARNTNIPAGNTQLAENVLPETQHKPHMGTVDEYKVNLLPIGDMDKVIEEIRSAMETFLDIAESNLTDSQRRRKIGAGVRNYGFIEKVADLAEANPQYTQFFDLNSLHSAIMNFDMCRNQLVELQSFVRSTTNTMLIYSHEGYGMSLIFYNIVRDMGRRGDPKALSLFRILQPFFKRPKRSSAELTEKQAEREMHSLLHGKKDGKLIVENIRPKLSGGVHKVIEEKFNDTEKFKDSIEGNISE